MQLSNLDGVLLIDKAPGMTSHDVVAMVRRALNTKKVGHCGTLDPLATGLLIVVIGRGTKIQDLLMSEDKEYVGTMTLGAMTDSQDADGQVTETRPVPELAPKQIEAAFAKFDGDFYQMPPMVSAIKQGGVPLYKLARQGKTVEREPRFVHVFAHEIKQIALPEIEFRVVCSKGFYVRTYAFDIGNELGCGAHLKTLRRTKSGKFNLERSVTVDDLRTKTAAELTEKIISLPEVSRMRGA
ncbi:MAG: tRNA pseudouridine(55) synthase TruB [Verrucomicrobiota bacterium]